MDKLKGKNVIIIGIFIILVVVLIILTKKDITNNNNNTNESNNNFNYILLTDASKFFTVEGCINRYLNVLVNKSTKDLIKLLDEKYIKQNFITEDNVLSKLASLDGIYSFSAKKIYVEKIDNYVSNYYVYGLLKEDTINNSDLGTDYYIIVKMDSERLLFSITPYDGEVFKEDI